MKKTRLQTRMQMYDKNRHTKKHTNVWKKRIQMYEKNTLTNTDTNVWQKQAYKCMKKTRLQTRIQMYDKNTHTNVWKKHAYKHAYKCMINTCFYPTFVCVFVCGLFFIHFYAFFFHTFLCRFFSYICMRVCLYLGRPWHSGDCGCPITRGLAVQSPLTALKKDWCADTWRGGSSLLRCPWARYCTPMLPGRCNWLVTAPVYEYIFCFFHTFEYMFLSYICMTKTYKSLKKTSIQIYEKNILIYWSGGQPITAPREHGGTVSCSRAPQKWTATPPVVSTPILF